jgi:hypothetical protein
MNPPAPDVVNLAEHVGSRLGETCGGVELVADRRGSRVYRLQFPASDVALKFASHNAEEEQGVREAEHLARREAAVLTHLHDFTPGYLIDSGDLGGGGSWLALRWLEGITPHRLFTPARQGDDSPAQRDSILRAAIAIADWLTQFHALGMASRRPSTGPHPPRARHCRSHRLRPRPRPLSASIRRHLPGGMVDFTAPETAAHLLATPDEQSIAIDERAEVYALAAVLHLAWTGLPPPTYTHDHAPWSDKLKDVALGRHHDLAAIRPWPRPAFEKALRHALRPEPEDRVPSMTRFRDDLSSGKHAEVLPAGAVPPRWWVRQVRTGGPARRGPPATDSHRAAEPEFRGRLGRAQAELLLAEVYVRAGESQGLTLAHDAIEKVIALQSVALRRQRLVPLATALEARPGSDARELARTARQVAAARI